MVKTALVTGATSGIGFELAKLLAKDHYNLVLVARTTDKLAEVKNDFETNYGVKVVNIPGDLSNRDFPQVIFDILKKQNRTVDVLVNNAGFGDWGPFAESDWKKQEEMIQVNITALLNFLSPNI